MYGSSLETCRDNIIADIKRCFTKTLKSKSYLVKCLENKLKYCFDNFYPHSVFCRLVSCNRKIRAVGKCNLCTRFYVENKSMMILLRSTVTFSSFLTADFDINKIFSEVKKSIAYVNVFYKTSDFIHHGPERVKFGETFRELIDKRFALYVLYFEVFFRMYFNELKSETDFLIFTCFFDRKNDDCKPINKTLFNIYFMHLKKLSVELNSNILAEKISDLLNFLLTESKHNSDQILVWNEAVPKDFD